MKRTILILGGVILGVLIIGGTFVAADKYLSQPKAEVATLACKTKGTAHVVTIADSKLSVVHTYAKACDTLTITNEDNQLRLMAFGEHDHHQPYDGVEEKTLGPGQSLTVTLNQVGTFTFHDHVDDSSVGQFTVTN